MSKKKGDRREREATNLLEEAGWTVETPNHYRYGNKDFFNLFDFMAFKEGEKPIFGQVKSNGPSGIRSFSEECKEQNVPFDFVQVEYWTCYDGAGWRIDKIERESYETTIDERDESCNMGELVVEHKE